MYLCCMACGLQNAMASTHGGAIIRTTHVTGLWSDFGESIGQRLRGMSFDRRRVWLYVALIGGFSVGGAAGAVHFVRGGYSALVVPAAITCAAATWCVWHEARA